MASVTLERVGKSFHSGAPALRDLSLSIADGEFVSLVGPSGCGKSTTLNLIAGLDQPSSGTLRIGDRIVNDLSPAERDVAMVFQSYALYPHKDVRGNLAFPLQVARVDRAEIERRVSETAEVLGIRELLARKPRELSGGQRQRVALGRALVRRPQVYLFDEPLSNLDAALRMEMRAEIKALHQRLRATFVYVTHDQAEAMTLSDRIALLRAGELQQISAPREIYRKPVNQFVAAFFGSPRINLVAPAALGLTGDGVAGVRPEDIEISPARVPGSVAAVVELVELTGAETWVTLSCAGERVLARAPAEFSLERGGAAWIRAQRHLRFDGQGRTIL
jgi:multiple sugar transport system ATP-binding protein